MAAKTDRAPPTTLAAAGDALAHFMVRMQHRDKHKDATPPLLHSGSGLTPENELSANDLVNLLAHEYRDTRDFGAFYGGLVVPRQAPFVFLRHGTNRWLDRVALKTGTMGEPHSVCGVAGYIRKQDGGWIAFAAIVNGGADHNKHVPMYKALEAIRTDIDQLLARY
jgi:D-alanyl-D-alanine carboxypeptidase/D-alanyl-D-alanine-endopeptidase (penicillin-binding protein 4)